MNKANTEFNIFKRKQDFKRIALKGLIEKHCKIEFKNSLDELRYFSMIGEHVYYTFYINFFPLDFYQIRIKRYHIQMLDVNIDFYFTASDEMFVIELIKRREELIDPENPLNMTSGFQNFWKATSDEIKKSCKKDLEKFTKKFWG